MTRSAKTRSKWFAGIVLPALVGCNVVTGNGDVITEQRDVSGFSRVQIAGPFDVQVTDQSSQRVLVTADSNVQPYIQTSVQGDTLLIEPSPRTTFSHATFHIDVGVPVLTEADFSGSGSFDIAMLSQGRDLTTSVEGSGLFTINAQLGAFSLQETGSGDANLTGGATNLSAQLSGSGRLDARDMPVQDAALALSGSGSILALVDHAVSLMLTGSGTIDWWGNATVISTTSTGSGHITHHSHD